MQQQIKVFHNTFPAKQMTNTIREKNQRVHNYAENVRTFFP